jgi:hypothetical protein
VIAMMAAAAGMPVLDLFRLAIRESTGRAGRAAE